jgi:hypothetical protein
MPPLLKRCRVALPTALAIVALAGCGQTNHLGNPRIPLIAGARVLQQIWRCDQGSNVFCSLDLVVADRDFQSAGELLKNERHYLRRLGWTLQAGEIRQERSAVSPDRKFRIVYATAAGDLLAIDLGWVKRPEPIALALSRTMFDHVPAISLMVEAGPA